MQILMSIFLLMLGSSLIMVGFVWVKDIKHKKSLLVEISNEDDKFFEDIQPAKSTVKEFDYIQKTA